MISADIISRLTELLLTPEQMVGVLAILSDAQKIIDNLDMRSERDRETAAARMKRYRERQKQRHSYGNSDVAVTRNYEDCNHIETIEEIKNKDEVTRNVTRNGLVPPITPSILSLQTDEILSPPSPEKKAEVGVSAREPQREIDEEFNRIFWPPYPNKVGKPAARRAYPAARKRAGGVMAILAGLDRYVHTKPGERPWLNPATFLNQDRWNDQPASESPPNGHRFNGKSTPHETFLRGLAAAVEKRNGGGQRPAGPDERVPGDDRTIDGDFTRQGTTPPGATPRLL